MPDTFFSQLASRTDCLQIVTGKPLAQLGLYSFGK